MQSRLKFSKAYLVGPMDRCVDKKQSKQWRIDLSEWLIEKIGVIPLDPYNKPLHSIHTREFENEEHVELRKNAIQNLRRQSAKDLMKPIVSIDLRMVDHSDFLIAYLDIDSSICGTFDEMFTATDQNKPVIVMCPQGVSKIYDWLWGRLRPELFFDNWDSVKTYLWHIACDANASIDCLDRWKFFDLEKVIARIIKKNE